jgi:multidrug resistance efflux pump
MQRQRSNNCRHRRQTNGESASLQARLSLILTFAVAAFSLPLREIEAEETGWITFTRCPVMVERSVEVPAQERGILKALHVELNQSVSQDAIVAELDTDLAEMEVRARRLEHTLAVELAEDSSNVKYHQVALRKVEEELESHRSIRTSISESELRRLTLSVDQAQLALTRAMQSQRAAAGEAQLKHAAVDIAELHLARRRITAPLNGIVTALMVLPGQSVEVGQPIMEIRNLENLVVDRLISIHQMNVADLVGAEVRVDVTQSDGEIARLSGEITSYDPEVSSQGMVRVHARIKNVRKESNWILLPGSEVSMHVAKPSSRSASAGLQPALKAR